MIRHRLLCLGYFDFGSVGLFNLGSLSLFAAYAQQSQNAAADVQSSQPTDVVVAVTGLRTLGGVVISWLMGVIITAACIAGAAAMPPLLPVVSGFLTTFQRLQLWGTMMNSSQPGILHFSGWA